MFIVQETQNIKKTKKKWENFVIYESMRSLGRGGSMMGFHESMNPVLISRYEN